MTPDGRMTAFIFFRYLIFCSYEIIYLLPSLHDVAEVDWRMTQPMVPRFVMDTVPNLPVSTYFHVLFHS